MTPGCPRVGNIPLEPSSTTQLSPPTAALVPHPVNARARLGIIIIIIIIIT